MTRPLLRLAAITLAAGGVLAAAPAGAVPLFFSFTMSGPQENPPVPSAGTGTALVAFDADANVMTMNASFGGLVSPSTVAHIHCCVAPPANVGVATTTPTFPDFPVGVTSGSYSRTFDTSLASTYNAAFITASGGTVELAEARLLAGLVAGQAYFNVHSQQFPNGEIRGFSVLTTAPVQVPEPASFALFTLGLASLALARRRATVPTRT